MFTQYKAKCNTKTTVNQKHIYTGSLDAKVNVFCIRGSIKEVLINDYVSVCGCIHRYINKGSDKFIRWSIWKN